MIKPEVFFGYKHLKPEYLAVLYAGQYMPRSQQPRWRQLANCRNCGAPGPLVSDHHNALASYKCEYCLTPLETTT